MKAFLQRTLLSAVVAGLVGPGLVLVSGCSTPDERADVRQNERIESRTDERIENRR